MEPFWSSDPCLRFKVTPFHPPKVSESKQYFLCRRWCSSGCKFDYHFRRKKHYSVIVSHPLPLSLSGEYSCLKVELIFKREFSYYLITIYVPCCMLVIVSWVSFWLDQNAIPARVSLGVTTLLTMSTQASGINAQLPPVSYTKAIDVWTGVSET